MKVSRIKFLLSTYSDDTELMISWNDKEGFTDDDQLWSEAVKLYDESALFGFGDDCRWAISEAERASE